MEPSVKVAPSMPTAFNTTAHSAPLDESCAAQLAFVHPLRSSEQNYEANQANITLHMLRTREGIHAPLKLKMEQRAVAQVGRLPFLASSNASLDSLSGRDESIDFADYLGRPENSELMRQPHALTEKVIGF